MPGDSTEIETSGDIPHGIVTHNPLEYRYDTLHFKDEVSDAEISQKVDVNR